ncbi:MAG: hypothetical protein ABI629_00785 [bacterium]
MTIVAVLGAASAAAASGVNPLRCEARKLRVESQFYECGSRCDRRATREGPSDNASPAADTDCDANCAARYDVAMHHADTTSPCVLDGEPDPPRCEARLLRVRASERVCQSRCARRTRHGADATECLVRCQTRCGTVADDTLAQMVCAAGRMNGSEICTAE